MKNTNVISEEIALNELELFINRWVKKPEAKDKLKDAYSNIFDAIMAGRLVINDDKVPTYTLEHPIKNSDKEITLSQIDFKTRVKPVVQADLADGLDLSKQSAKFALRCIAYITGQPTAMLDNFEKEDYNLIREVAALFM